MIQEGNPIAGGRRETASRFREPTVPGFSGFAAGGASDGPPAGRESCRADWKPGIGGPILREWRVE